MTTEAKKTDATTLAKRAPNTPLEVWKADLFAGKTIENLSRALSGTGTNPERFASVAYMTTVRNPDLLVPARMKLWLGVYAAAECGLSLQPTLQHMHLVPFNVKKPEKAEVQTIVGYQGLSLLVSKSGSGLMDTPQVVYDRDVEEGRFKYLRGTRKTCELNPVPKDPKRPRGLVRYVFTTFTNTAGITVFHVVDRDELLATRERSASWQAFKKGWRKSSPWNPELLPDGSEAGDFLAMCLKTGVRRHAKYLPKSADHWGERTAKAEEVDTRSEAGESFSDVLDTTWQMAAEETGNDALKRELGTDDAATEDAP